MIKARHIAIRVKDVEKSLAFYRDVLGLSYVRTRDRETYKAVDLTDGEANLTLLYANNSISPAPRDAGSFGLDHIGFIVDDIDYVYNRLRTAGVEFVTPAPADFFKVLDPDGVIVDIASIARGW